MLKMLSLKGEQHFVSFLFLTNHQGKGDFFRRHFSKVLSFGKAYRVSTLRIRKLCNEIFRDFSKVSNFGKGLEYGKV